MALSIKNYNYGSLKLPYEDYSMNMNNSIKSDVNLKFALTKLNVSELFFVLKSNKVDKIIDENDDFVTKEVSDSSETQYSDIDFSNNMTTSVHGSSRDLNYLNLENSINLNTDSKDGLKSKKVSAAN